MFSHISFYFLTWLLANLKWHMALAVFLLDSAGLALLPDMDPLTPHYVREAGLPLGSGRRACGEMARLLHCQLLGEQILSTDIKLLFAPTFIYKMPNPKKLCRLL